MLPNPLLALAFYYAYVSGSSYLPTHGVRNIAGSRTSLRDSRSSHADLEDLPMPIVLNCPASLCPLSLTAEGIPDRRIGVVGVQGIACVTSSITVAGHSTAWSLVILVWVDVVALVLSGTLCSGTCVSATYFGQATASCGSRCSRLLTSPILSSCGSCTDACHLRLDLAFPLPLFCFLSAISTGRMVPSVNWLC